MLAIMPMFHGFGLGVSIHSHGGQRWPLPDPPLHPSELRRAHQSLQAQSHRRRPSLFEALLRVKEIEGADLSCLKVYFSGGDSRIH